MSQSSVEQMNLNRDELLSQLRQMDDYEFEQLVGDVWEQRGWKTTVTSGQADRGIDVIAEKSTPFHQKHLIQAKRYSKGNKIGSPDVQQYSSLQQQESNVDSVIIVTTSSFSPQAKEIAKKLNVKLVDGAELSGIILNNEPDLICESYFNSTELNINDTTGETTAESDVDGSDIKDAHHSDKQKHNSSILTTIFNISESLFDICPICQSSSIHKDRSIPPAVFTCEYCDAKLKQDWGHLSIQAYYTLVEGDSELVGESKKVSEWRKSHIGSSKDSNTEIITKHTKSKFDILRSNGFEKIHGEKRKRHEMLNFGHCPLCAGDKMKIIFDNIDSSCPLYEYTHRNNKYIIEYEKIFWKKEIESKNVVGCKKCGSIWVPKNRLGSYKKVI